VVAAARSQKIKFKKAKRVKEVPGRGLRSTVNGQEVVIGRLSFLEDNQVKVPAKARRGSPQESVVYVAVDGLLAGLITLKDELRPEAQATLRELNALGIRETLMVTGDNQATAQAIAKQLDISHVHAEALPADKLRILDDVKDRPMAFVGDGVNDAPILTAADIGIALGARGSAAASESADMVIMLDDLGRVAAATKIAKRTFQIARQSILVGIGLSTFLMLIFATGAFNPLAGAIVQEAVDVVVIFNALRAHMIEV
jgi:P-type E1-E2 ATPase